MRLYGKERGVRGHARHERQPARRGKRVGRGRQSQWVYVWCAVDGAAVRSARSGARRVASRSSRGLVLTPRDVARTDVCVLSQSQCCMCIGHKQ